MRTERFVARLGEQLAQRYPNHADQLRANTEALRDEIHAMHKAHEKRLADLPRRELVTFHNAFDHMAGRYDLHVVAHLTPIELTPAGEVTPARLKEAVRTIERHQLPVVYAEPQLPDTALAALRERTGVAVLRLDPIGDAQRAGHDSWQALMRSNLDTLVKGQRMQRDAPNTQRD